MFLLLIILIATSISVTAQTPSIEKFLDGANVMGISGDGKYIWAATNGNGVFRIDRNDGKISEYSTANRKLQQDFFFTIETNRQYVWAGSADGLFMLDKRRNTWSKRKFAKGGQLANWVRSLKYDPDENVLWIGRFMYLTKFDINKKRFYDYDLTQKRNMKTNTIKTIALDGDSLVWFGTEAGLHKYDKSMDLENELSVTFYDNRLNYFEGLGDQVSISALLVAENKLWIGLDEFITPENPEFNLGGLFRFDRKNEWIRYDKHTGLNGNGIFAIERTGNLLWVAQYQFGKTTKEQYGRGVSIINMFDGSIKDISDQNIPNMVNALYFDGSYLWMGAEDGLYRLDLTNNFASWN